MASSPEARDVFSHALETLKAELTPQELEIIQNPSSFDGVLSTAEEMSKKDQHGHYSQTLEKLYTLKERLDPLNGVLEGVCKLPPCGGDLIWGSVRLVFQVSNLMRRSGSQPSLNMS